MTRWVVRYYSGRFVLLHDGKYIGESPNPIALILTVSYFTYGRCPQ